MTAKEAYKCLVEKWGNVRVINCIEYRTMFVFAFSGIAGSVSVDKKTGSVSKFIPSTMPLDEFLSGVKVTAYK